MTTEQKERCRLCNGRGYKITWKNGGRKGPKGRTRNCSRCDGRGQVTEGSRNPQPQQKQEPQP